MNKAWIEAVRLRTLPVSIAGVLTGVAAAIAYGCFSWLPALLCLLFAVTAQIASNFANEYFDFRNGLDKPGRDGFRRGLAEGDLTPKAMKAALMATLALAALFGLSLIYWGGWWLIAAGIIILIGAVAYSGGPWPLSHHGLGDVAVVLFYGVIPVFFTLWLQAVPHGMSFASCVPGLPLPLWGAGAVCGAGIGLMGANVLIVNNYRDMDDDRAVGKHTTVVMFGRKVMAWAYLFCWLAGDLLLGWPLAEPGHSLYAVSSVFVACALLQFLLWRRLRRSSGPALNVQLRLTAQMMLFQVLMLLCCVAP